jgi:hypothetical protein
MILSMQKLVPPPVPKASVLLARQPIMDESRRVLGYELLYRGLREREASFDTTATARVICETLSHIGADAASSHRLRNGAMEYACRGRTERRGLAARSLC